MKIEVHLLGGLRKIIDIDPFATKGAVVGKNLYFDDGTLVTRADFGGTTTPPQPGTTITAWSLILDIPPNVTALENTHTTGLYVVTGSGTSGTREIQGTTGQIDVASGDGVAGDPIISLSDFADAGTGTFKLLARDPKGRLAGTLPGDSDDVPEGVANLYFTVARVRATVLTGLSLASALAVSAADTVLSALGKLQAQVTLRALSATTISTTAPLTGGGNLSANRTFAMPAATASAAGHMTAASMVKLDSIVLPKGYIDGLKMMWVSGNALTVSSGAAYIEASGEIISAPSAIAKSSMSLSASTWYHVYLYLNTGTPDIEIVTTVPSAPYDGTARSKSADTSRRYIGSVKTNASGAIFKFAHNPCLGDVTYYADINNFLALSGGLATTTTNVSCSLFVPVTSISAKVFAEVGASDLAFISNQDIGSPASTNISFFLRASQQVFGILPLSSVQDFSYALTPSTTGLSVWVCGYYYER